MQTNASLTLHPCLQGCARRKEGRKENRDGNGGPVSPPTRLSLPERPFSFCHYPFPPLRVAFLHWALLRSEARAAESRRGKENSCTNQQSSGRKKREEPEQKGSALAEHVVRRRGLARSMTRPEAATPLGSWSKKKKQSAGKDMSIKRIS